jgi:hypothetical protein
MERRASSVSEMEQIVRVHRLLTDIGVCPSPYLRVVTASGKTFSGQLVKDLVGSVAKVDGWNCYGSITLSNESGMVDIDYLDIVTAERSTQRSTPHPKARRGENKRRRSLHPFSNNKD